MGRELLIETVVESAQPALLTEKREPAFNRRHRDRTTEWNLSAASASDEQQLVMRVALRRARRHWDALSAAP
jgi:hypothetical protein